jgi:biopolymer transport protein ExbD
VISHHPRCGPRTVAPFDHGQPIRRIELGPVAGALLVIVAVMLGALPVRTHALVLDFPSIGPPPDECFVDTRRCPSHQLVLATDGTLTWDNAAITPDDLRARIANMDQWASVNVTPAAGSSYADTLKLLNLLREVMEPGRIVWLCDLERSRRFEIPQPEESQPIECTGAVFGNWS